MNQPSLAKPALSLMQALQQQHDQLVIMLDILKEEHHSLSTTDINGFEHIVAKKQTQVKNLEETQVRLNIAAHILEGGILSNTSLSRYINIMPAGETKKGMTELWQAFKTTVENCRQQNIANNQIMDASSTYLRQAIRILRGDPTEPVASLYESSGKQSYSNQGKSLAMV
jgi:flagellar biosynthesis/type III secretory pathway chaperone